VICAMLNYLRESVGGSLECRASLRQAKWKVKSNKEPRMGNSNRRDFMKSSAVRPGYRLSPLPRWRSGSATPNERIRVAMVGLGGRMRSHIGSLGAMAATDNVEIAAICDCDQRKLDGAVKSYPELAGLKLKTFTDQRKLFRRPVDRRRQFLHPGSLARVANHFGPARGQGRVCGEAATWCIWEGRKMVEAARKYGRMVQAGTQNRSSPNVREGMQKLQRRRDRQSLHGPRGDLQNARQISASTAPARCRKA